MTADEAAKDLVQFLNLPKKYIACWVNRKSPFKPVICISINPDYINKKKLTLPTYHLGFNVREKPWSAPVTGEVLKIAQQWVAN